MPQKIIAPPGTDLNRSLGLMAAGWIEHACVHGFGDVQGERVTFDKDVIKLLLYMYAIDQDGRRLVKQAVACMPKGSSKSELASFLMLFESYGPCRGSGEIAEGGEVYVCPFTGWTWTYNEGEHMARRIDATLVRVMAADLVQARTNTFKTVFLNFDPDSDNPLAGVAKQGKLGITDDKTGSEIRFSSSSAPSKEGGLETFVVTDELHLYTDRESKEAYTMLIDNLDKRRLGAEPWVFSTSTMHRDGEKSMMELVYKEAMAYDSGDAENLNGLLFYWNYGPLVEDFTDVQAVRESLVEAYQGRTYVDYDGLSVKPMSAQTDPMVFEQKFLNRLTTGTHMFVSSAELERATSSEDGSEIPDLAVGDTIAIGIDGSWGNQKDAAEYGRKKIRKPDSFAVVAYRPKDGTLHTLIIEEASFADMAAGGTWTPDRAKIEARIHRAFREQNVVAVFADPSGIQGFLDQLTAKYGRRLKVKASLAFPMYRYMSGASAEWFGEQIAVFYKGLVDGSIKLADGLDSRLAEHFRNARRSPLKRSELWTVFKRTADSDDKIDALPASVLAWAAGRIFLNKGGAADKRRGPKRVKVHSKGVM